ncbi:hypothetical protein X733_32840 [Mesorhizobium sp. L2C067A000]|nr:hypothetical protein X733_32840 [Mesorhizobium sp. L2C067A000]
MQLHGMDQAGATVGFCAAQGDDFYAELNQPMRPRQN